MVKDALKFFHAYINEMIDLGGENLPRAVSTKLGSKLADIIKAKGYIGLEPALKQIYKVLGAKTSIKKIDDHSYDIVLRYSKRFCPIGGKRNPKQAKIIQNNLCIPYTKSFLSSLLPNFLFEAHIKECILDEHSNRHCNYLLETKLKNE
ncbi:MAG: hypothetical protein ACFFEO_01755 [Candidatus Thorarchaeota archaeon]